MRHGTLTRSAARTTAARWPTAQGVVAIGRDNMAVEVQPNPNRTLALPVHQHALAETGVRLIENLALEEPAVAGIARFCFILLAVKFRGATGSRVRPVALVPVALVPVALVPVALV